MFAVEFQSPDVEFVNGKEKVEDEVEADTPSVQSLSIPAASPQLDSCPARCNELAIRKNAHPMK